jgi:hypothetical protein
MANLLRQEAITGQEVMTRDDAMVWRRALPLGEAYLDVHGR